jgi:hypothetical protein
MALQFYKTNWLPGYGRAFVASTVESLGNGDRGGETLTIRLNPIGEIVGLDQKLFTFKIPQDVFEDIALLPLITDVAENKIICEAHEIRMKSGIQFSEELNPKLNVSSISEFIFAMMLANGKKALLQIQGKTKSGVLTEELGRFIKLSNFSIKKES